MVVRRNDRRRRLMNDEYVQTIELGSPAQRGEQEGVVDGVSARRTYASGADRRNQLRTTDLFPKRIWLIVTFGLLLISLIAGINVIAWHAESWRWVLGPEGVAALQLGGAGTLASWFTCFLMLSVALASLQVYALRRHRCDDYVGTYRMWMWFPPIFMLASLASIVDVGAIARNVFDATLGLSIPPGSLLPLVVVLVILAMLAGRVLFEVKESRAAVAMIVMAWLSLAVSVTMQTEWAGNQIAASDRQIVLKNSYLISAAALLMGHLFYTRFVYLHAHGLIVRKQAKATKAETAASNNASKKAARNKQTPITAPAKAAPEKVVQANKSSKAAVAANKKKAASKLASPKAPAARPATVKMPKVAKVTPNTSAKEASAKPNSPVPANAEAKPTTMNSFKSLMDKRKSDQLAAAAAAKKEPIAESEPPATLKMTKAERKRARKAKRAGRKAA